MGAMAPSRVAGYCPGVLSRRLLARHGDYALAGIIAAVYLSEVSFGGNVSGSRAAAAVVALAFAATLALRRRMPLLALLAGLAVVELDNTLLEGLAETGAFLFGFVVAIYSAGRHGRGRVLVGSVLVMLAVIPLAAFEPGEPVGFSDIAFFFMFFGGPFVAGRIVRYRRERERALLGHAAALELERDEKARQAVVEERTRIARELHDVVAHAISVIVLQARGGRRMLRDDPDDALQAFDAIEHAGEQALVEMRRLLGMLRADEEQLALAPQPSLSRIEELAAKLSSIGLPVEVTIEGEPVELPPGIDVSAYRIVQEALTNALKHAGPARAHVLLRYRADELELEVLDNGAGTGNGEGSGHGLAGIRERVGIYGGELESGRRPEGGYALRARLPLGLVR
jgi:signal transduction histidine kinase